MNRNHLEKYKESGRIQLTNWETCEHYHFLFFILIIPLTFLFTEISNTGTISGVPIFELTVFGIAGYFIRNRYKALEFKKYSLNHLPKDFNSAAKATAIELNWNIEKLTDNFLLASKHGLAWQRDGIKIIILRDGDKIYLNSMITPSMGSNPFSLGWNKKNLQTFYKNLVFSTKGEDVVGKAEAKVSEEEIRFENQPEWSLKNTFKRIIIYFIVFTLLGVCILIMTQGFNIIVLPIGGICIGYLIMDWMVIIKKRKPDHNKT